MNNEYYLFVYLQVHILSYPTAKTWNKVSVENCERLARLQLEDARLAALGVELPPNAPQDYGSGAYGENHHDLLFPHG